jgi:hypothetical protein
MFVHKKAHESKHKRTKQCTQCKQGTELKHKRYIHADSKRALKITFTENGIPLERVNTFKYLGRQVGSIDDDWPILYKNLNKTRGQWGSVSQVLLHEVHDKCTSGMFYKAVAQSVACLLPTSYRSVCSHFTHHMRYTEI